MIHELQSIFARIKQVNEHVDGYRNVSGGRSRDLSSIAYGANGTVGRWDIALAMFLLVHISIWSPFPVWYHLAFLLAIVPSVLAGALTVKRSSTTSPRSEVRP